MKAHTQAPHRNGLAAVALLTLSLPSLSSLPAPPPIGPELPAAACTDKESPEDRQRRGSRLLVHDKLASHLLQLRSEKQHLLDDYRCEGAAKAYHARIADQDATVESRYLPGGTVHATIHYQAARRHGVQRTLWPDGAVQSVEYYCRGQPVGFHRYHDTAGRLVAIADHASSDYRWQRRLQGLRTTIEAAKGASEQVEQRPQSGNIHIRRLFDVQGGTQVGAAVLQRPGVGGYQSLNAEASLAQLVTAGDQGWISVEGRRMRIINAPMDYMPFWEAYERERKGLPGAEPLAAEIKDILACPWIDEAMAAPLQHAALARPAVAALTDADRQATPRARYLACLQQPSESCLMPFALPLVQSEQSHRDLYLRATAVAALAVRQPGVAAPAIAELFTKESGFSRPNPYFAVPELLRAQAAQRAGDKAGAEAHAKAALAHAQRVVQAHESRNTLEALRRTGPELARMGFADLAGQAYEQLRDAGDPGAAEVLAAVGEAHAQAGRLDAAASAAAQLRQAVERPLSESERDKGVSRWYSPRATHAHALALVAQGLAQKGETARARELLARADAEFARVPASGAAWGNGQERLALALAHASVGNTGPVRRLAEPPAGAEWMDTPWATTQRQALEGLCEAGREAYLVDGRAYPHVLVPRLSAYHAMARFGALVSAHMRCGQVPAARALLEQAKTYDAPTPLCRSIDSQCATARHGALANAMLEAGQMDMLAEWATGRALAPRTQMLWAERLAEAGDQPAARSRLAALPGPDQRRQSAQHIHLVLAQARVEGSASRPDPALLEVAHTAAGAMEEPQERAEALLLVAQAYTAAGEPARARELLAAARAGFDSVLGGSQWQAGMAFSGSAMQLGRVAQGFVAAGSLEEALKTANALYQRPGTLAAQYQSQGLDARVEAAIFARQAAAPRSTTTTTAQAAFAALPPGKAKAQALDQVLRAAATRPGAAAWQAVALRELAASDAYFASATSSRERRALIGLLAGWLRLEPRKGAALQLEQLAAQARRIDTPAWRARSLCELGFTGTALGLPAGKPLLQEGAALAASHDSRFFPLDPAPTGACAHWARRAGDKEAAASLVERTVEPLRGPVRRQPDGQHPAHAGGLLNASIALFEAEHGELAVDWIRAYWRD